LELLAGKLPKGARVLDIGCGTGVPVARQLSRIFEVAGVDLSSEMVLRARKNVPSAAFIHSDIMTADLPGAHYDAVVAMYTVFHLPREEHRDLFRRVHRWLKPGGYFLATVSEEGEAPYIEEDFFGTTMYWSNYGRREYLEMFRDTGFHVLESDALGHGYHEDHHATLEHHPLILAQKVQG
jgi:cyclopropane fatty-acyl-phospholipid synthase-like methyltransferase